MTEDDLYQIVWLSRPMMQAAEGRVERDLAGSGLTVRTRAVLEILAREGAVTVPDLARHLQIQRQYVQVMVNETLAQDLTEKQPNPRHQRSPLITLTEAGRAMVEPILKQELAFMADIAQGLDPHEVKAALKISRLLIERLSETAGRGGA